MIAKTSLPTDRASFNGALSAVRSEHATLRRLAVAASKQSAFSADDVMSLVDAMAAHESTEAGLFALPLITRTPAAVTATAVTLRRRCLEYTSGKFGLPDPRAAAGKFIDALLAHLAAEEAWFADEEKHQQERLSIAA